MEAASAKVNQSLVIVGINHRTAAVEVRERLAFRDEEVVPALSRLRLEAPSIAEAALISTCNRVEVIAVAENPEPAAAELEGFLAAERGVQPQLFARRALPL